MNISAPFIRRPVATTLLTLAIALAGWLAFFRLPAAPMPQVDLPAIYVWAQMSGASPETMATTVATPLERRLSAIAGVTEMTSSSEMGTSTISLQFSIDRDIDGAARDVQAAINAARADLPTSLRANPVYFKANLATWPIAYLSLTSATLSVDRIYEIAETVLREKLASIPGVGRVYILGSAPPAVRVELNPDALFKYGVGLESIRAALAAANANSPKGAIETGERRFQIYANDRASKAADYRELIVAYRNGLAVKLSDLAEVVDSVEDFGPAAMTDGKASILVRIYRAPGANVIGTVNRIKARLSQLRASLPGAIDLAIVSDRTATIRASLRDLEHALLVSVILVILTVFAFLQSARAAMVTAVVVPVSLLGAFGVMHLFGYSLDSLSLMALIIATGLVIDDSVIVLENISRHLDNGTPRLQAALSGAREVGFTVLSMSLSLVAAFIPMLLMGDVLGRVFREFAVTLSAAVLISLVISLTTAPMLCAIVLEPSAARRPSSAARIPRRAFWAMLRFYDRTLVLALRHSWATLAVLLAVLGLNITLYMTVPKGLLPQQDPGRLFGFLEADQNISAALMREKLADVATILLADPAVKSLAGTIEDGARRNSAELYVELKPRPQREETADEVNFRLSRSVSEIAGVALHLVPPQDISFGARPGGGQYQYTLQGDDIAELRTWTLRLTEALRGASEIHDPNSDQGEGGLEANLVIDRNTASRLGVATSQIDNTLYDAFGQRQVSTIYAPLNQRHVVMEVAPQYRQSPEILDKIYVSTSGGPTGGVQSTNSPAGTVTGPRRQALSSAASIAADSSRNLNLNALANSTHGPTSTSAPVSTVVETMVPLSAIAHFEQRTAPLSVNHQGSFVAATISFNLSPKTPLSDAISAVERTVAEIHMPASIHGAFSGTAKTFQDSTVKQAFLILAALVTIYIVLGILYESFIHPITILSTLPSAGVGGILALMVLRIEFTVVAFIGVILLIGIVKKNAIMMIDFAIDAQRKERLSARDAIHRACLLRFRPIMMTTMAALFGALPLALGTGEGAELRQPLGIAIIGGLVVSQALTLYTTPVVYLYLDRLRQWRTNPPGIKQPITKAVGE